MKIGLINTKSQTMTPHLYSLGMAVKKEYPDSTLSSFTSNFSSLTSTEKTKQEKELQNYVNELDIICCINNSLPSSLTLKDKQRRILYAIPYDYLFKYFIEEQELGDAFYSNMQALSCFTEIHYFSWMQLDVLKKLCPLEKVAFKQAIHYPLALERPLSSLYPFIKEKKVIGLFTVTGTKIYDCQFDFSTLLNFISKLPPDYVVVTNNSLFFELARNMPIDFAQKFLYVPASIRNVYEMLDETDILLTDYSAYIASFVKGKKPFYTISYKESLFLAYMRDVHPSLMLPSLNGVSLEKLAEFKDEHEKFVEKFCIKI